MPSNTLQPTSWLAKRLGLSVSTIERLRARSEGDLPPFLVVGRRTVRYDEAVVDAWLAARQGQAPERDGAAGPVASVAPVAPAMPGDPKKKVFGKRLVASRGS